MGYLNRAMAVLNSLRDDPRQLAVAAQVIRVIFTDQPKIDQTLIEQTERATELTSRTPANARPKKQKEREP